jgi:ATP-dependent DNA helicase DinG
LKPSVLDLPYDDWNPGQWELITQIVTAFSEDKPYVLLEAPTGIGKSAIALGVSHLLDRRAVVLTGTRQLQGQYVDALKLRQAMGRQNFECDNDPRHRASDANCTLGVPCDKRGTFDCAYYAQKLRAQRSRDAVLNYAYWLAQANYAGAFKPATFRFPIIEMAGIESTPDPGILVCDEAHELESALQSFVAPTIYVTQCSELNLTPPETGADLKEWRLWALGTKVELSTEYVACQEDKEDRPSNDEIRRIKAVISVYEACETLIDPHVPWDNWVVSPKRGVGGIEIGVEFRPIWIQPFTQGMVLKHADYILFMSATILSKELWCNQLGIDPEKVTFIQADSPFSPSIRPLYIHSVGNVAGGDRDSYLSVTEAVDKIIARHPGERGIIHTTSYGLAKYIMANSRTKGRIVTNAGSDGKASALNTLRTVPGTVLVSPSVGTGVDLPYDLLRFQVIAKISFPHRGDPQIAARLEKIGHRLKYPKANAWYTWDAACRLVQAYGRGVRAVDDYCATYLLDGNWEWFHKSAGKLLPTWFRAAIKKSPALGVMVRPRSIEDQINEFRKLV